MISAEMGIANLSFDKRSVNTPSKGAIEFWEAHSFG